MAFDRDAGRFDAHHRGTLRVKHTALPLATLLAACASGAGLHTPGLRHLAQRRVATLEQTVAQASQIPKPKPKNDW